MSEVKPKIKQVKRFATVFRSFAVAGNAEEGFEYLEHLIDYNEQGQLVRETKFLEDGSTEEINTYTYDDKDKLTGHKLEYVPDEASESRVLERDSEGRVTRESKFYGDFSGERTEYTFSENGLVSEIKSFDEEGDFSTRETISYDEKKQIVQRMVYDTNDKVLEKREFTYSDDGSVEEKYYGKDGTLEKTTTAKKDDQNREAEVVERTGQGKLISAVYTRYDEKGNVIDRHHKDFNSKILRYSYDEENRCTGEEVFDENGMLLRKHIFEFDTEGKIIAEQSYEMNASRGARDKHLAIRYEYETYE